MSVDFDEIIRARAEADCLADEQDVAVALNKLASEISARLADKNPIVFAVMNGGLILAGQLLTRLSFPLESAYMHVSRYGHALQGNYLDWRVRPSQDLQGRHVLVLDDILDEGHTLKAIVEYLYTEGAKEVLTAVLVHKTHDRKAVPNMRANFTGLDVADRFLFGCGMDYKGYWRNAPGIYALKGH